MTQTHRRLAVMGTLLFLFTASPVCAWHIDGHVFCDQNGNQMIDAGDTPLNSVGILITSLTFPPGTTFPATTNSAGFFFVALPDHDDDYRVELTGTGLPGGASTIVPSSGAYGVAPVAAIHLQASAFAATADFLVNGCVATPSPSSTPTPSPSSTPTPSATETPVPTDTPVSTATPTPTPTSTSTPTSTPTRTSTPTPGTPTSSPTPASALLDFQCYEVDRSDAHPITGVNVVDRFGSGMIDLDSRKPVKRLCNPATVNSASPDVPTLPDHLLGYAITRRTPHFNTIFNQTVVNQFGTVVIRIVRPVLLLVPSAKSLVAPPAPLADPAIDHFQCYRVRGGRTSSSGVHIVDQFGAFTYKLLRVSYLCTAVDKNGEGILDPQANLLCYNLRPAGDPISRGLSGPAFTANQFGAATLIRVQRARELCVPSSVSP
ncbi:MAG: hypothetical protein HY271_01180 [Deltaproteobacteria bacterium]|nr:hypothetical protein [Deltaproteobacteria bacterium]